MHYLVSDSFRTFLENISVTRELKSVATSRRDAISQALRKQLNVLDIFATGSLMRGTALRGSSDLDIMAVLNHSSHVGKTPYQFLDSVRTVMSTYNARIVKKNGQAVSLYFATWPECVDLVPAKRVSNVSNSVLYIPDANTGDWIPTDPAGHDRAMLGISPRRRQLVRIIKCWNRAHSQTFQSFHIEKVVLAMSSYGDDSDSWPWLVYMFFAKAIEMTEAVGPLSPSYPLDKWRELRKRLERGKELAVEAWYAVDKNDDSKTSIERLRVLFGDDFPAYG